MRNAALSIRLGSFFTNSPLPGFAWCFPAGCFRRLGITPTYFRILRCGCRVIGDWIRFYNHRRPHQALNMKTPAEAFALAA
ncbi:integrase core domain-containing protein [Castellaniella sp. GW247-6E4]|uniref:integrase core domain-containing protein n=1 Tax=Castellaniella sp. GW247-6E4 TaxID=3140380 RepID=UPI00331554B4